MNSILLHSPFGDEILYQSTLDAVIEHLAKKLAAVTTQYAALPAVAQPVEWMLPTAQTEWESSAARGMVYLEVTPESLTGFGFSISLRDLPEIPPPSTVWECWGLAMAVAEGLRAGMDEPNGVTVFPLYVENALNLAVENLRVTVGLRRVISR